MAALILGMASRMTRKRIVALLLTALVQSGCSEVASAPDGPALTILRGADITDTISTTPPQGLVVEVRDENGELAEGVEVRFEAPWQFGNYSRMEVSGVGETEFGSLASARTDAVGKAVASVRLSERAGAGWVAVSVPLYGIADTARYVVLPGAATAVAVQPRDTMVASGGEFVYGAWVVDRASNIRSDPVSFEAVGNSVAVDAVGRVTTTGFGVTTVRLRTAALGITAADSAYVVVVPSARVAFGYPLRVSELTGANRFNVADGLGSQPSWEPGNNRIVFRLQTGGLAIANVSGGVTPLATPGISDTQWPDWSLDGQWIYFTGRENGAHRIFRMRPDGTGIESLAPNVAATMVAPSPDGRSIVYRLGPLVIQDLRSGTTRTLTGTEDAMVPRWSPDGAWIAYTKERGGELILIRPDGSGLHQVGNHGLHPGIGWSPDSRWIIGSESIGTLVDVQSRRMHYLLNIRVGIGSLSGIAWMR